MYHYIKALLKTLENTNQTTLFFSISLSMSRLR